MLLGAFVEENAETPREKERQTANKRKMDVSEPERIVAGCCCGVGCPENGDYNARPSCITLRRLHDGYASLNLKPMRASVWELQAAPVLAVDVKGRLCRSSRSSFRQYAVEHG
ncbi:hypothetical protein V9T40_006203 [Parthenolecanium corni]|uniref:Uncharacterized protein n=1 Tax=Parthenolecanium corni TaxID=536013 RepID=A0AAN9TU93_9HEMI